MKIKSFIILCICLLAFNADAGRLMVLSPVISSGTGEVQQELGYTTTTGGTPGNSTTGRCSRHTTAGAMTVTHGYWYTSDYQDDDSGTFTMSVYSSDGGSPSKPSVQVGGCSDSGTVTNNSFHWKEVTWSSNYPSLDASTEYFV